MKVLPVVLLLSLPVMLLEPGTAAGSKSDSPTGSPSGLPVASSSGSAQNSILKNPLNSNISMDRQDSKFVIPDTLTLELAYELALERFPLVNQVSLQKEIRDLRIKNVNTALLPDITLSGMVQYQSDVTEIDISLPGDNGFDPPTQPHDRYQIALDLEQPLYDGGRTRARRELENRRSDRSLQEIQVDQHELKDRINDAWFAILALRAQRRTLKITGKDLEEQLVTLRSQIEHGMVPESAADIIRAEQLRITQQKRSLIARERAAFGVLSQLLDTEIPENITLQLPEVPDRLPGPDFTARPEISLFEAYRRELSQQEEMVTASYRPRVSAFGQAAYGRPGLNMFEYDFQPWYMVGIRASWSLWNWRSDDRERQEIQLRHRLVDSRQEIFDRTMRMAVQTDLEKIAEMREAIRTDEEIIDLHSRIVNDAASRFENGTITATEYISELNNRQRAIINRELHQIQLATSWQNYLTTLGN